MYTASVIGGGFGGKLSLDALAASSMYRLLAVADQDPHVRRALSMRYPDAEIYATHAEMFENCPCDVVCVATPTPTHYVIVEEALRQRPLGLLVEKPLASHGNEAAMLLRKIEGKKLALVVPHGMFALSAPGQVLTLVRDDAVGALKSIEIQNNVDLLNAGIHWLTFVLALLEGDPMESVLSSCDTETCLVNDGMQVETCGVTCFRTRAGVSVLLQSGRGTSVHSDCLPEEQRKGALFRLVGSAGVIELHAWGSCLWLLNSGHPSGDIIECDAASNRSPHQWYLESLATQIEDRCVDYTIPKRSLQALELIEAAYRSAERQCVVTLPARPMQERKSRAWRPGQEQAKAT